mmetsp:Transcript_24042/g.44094  ORF Transcript_24042/g.44094 Transcript_24042/m.44094 type:complete len:219 (-) Transcript_24042:628-1284(-)
MDAHLHQPPNWTSSTALHGSHPSPRECSLMEPLSPQGRRWALSPRSETCPAQWLCVLTKRPTGSAPVPAPAGAHRKDSRQQAHQCRHCRALLACAPQMSCHLPLRQQPLLSTAPARTPELSAAPQRPTLCQPQKLSPLELQCQDGHQSYRRVHGQQLATIPARLGLVAGEHQWNPQSAAVQAAGPCQRASFWTSRKHPHRQTPALDPASLSHFRLRLR